MAQAETTFYSDDELPDQHHHRSRYHDFATELRAHPGMWAKYPTRLASPTARASSINNDAYGALPCTDFEAKVVREERTLYVRYYPEELRNTGRRRRGENVPRPSTTTANWAAVMFERVGPERADIIYKLLSRVLHPDMPLGDTVLQRELNDARKQK